MWGDEDSIAKLVGQTVVKVDQGEDQIVMTLSDGRQAVFYHSQDCCESVYVDDVNGDWGDLIGAPLLVAEERTSRDGPPTREYSESYTWTFYTFRTVKGSVDVRWLGESNGYYSERVSLSIRPAA